LLGRGDVALALLPGAHDIAKRLLLGGWNMHGGERAGTQREREIARIAPIGLDAFAGALGDQRRGGHDTVLALVAQVTLQPEATGPGFVDEAQRSTTGELLDQPIDRVLLGAKGAEIEGLLGRVAADTGGRDGIFVNVQSDEDGGIVVHADLRLRKPS
jgi:hypothetical protein